MLIIVKPRPLYGSMYLMPVNDAAKRLAAIAGTRSLTHSALAHATLMGATISIQDGSEFAMASGAAIDNLVDTIKEHGL